jgi:hypothetical protein
MTRTRNNSDLNRYASFIIKQAILWFFIVVGVIHQFLMYIGFSNSIYVFVDPPEYVYPFVTLAYQWWFVLVLGSFIAFLAAYSGRVQGVPSRFVVPFYAYLLYLLIFVRPISG